MKKIAHVGVDYHLDSLSIAVLVEGEKDFYETFHLRNTDGRPLGRPRCSSPTLALR